LTGKPKRGPVFKGGAVGKRLMDKVAVVTGAGRGIGQAIALLMSEEGAKVVVNDLGCEVNGAGASTMVADDVVAQIKRRGGTAVASHDSVAEKEGAERIIQSAVDSFGRLDILINNAGIIRDRMVFNLSDEDWDLVVRVHLYGTFYCTRAACRIMRQQRSGRIINMASSAALGIVGTSNYGAAKGGILAFTRNVARDMAKYQVTCNAIMPGAGTRILATTGIPDADRRPEDNAPLVVYLASDEAANINGCTFRILGGTIALVSDPQPVKILYKPERFTVDELAVVLPQALGEGLASLLPARD
jgi:NAD(P)-dependent dehydrogenase (short-subunit alcohol dehydrogenase family)